MRKLTSFDTWYGRDESPPSILKLQLGNCSIEFQDGDLRYYSMGGIELVRRVYLAVRDVNWNTIPAHITGLSIAKGEDHFQIEYDALHEDGLLKFRWHARLDGLPDGKVTIGMDGTAESDFRYCRIGFCVLHPIAGISGRPYRAVTPQGEVKGALPEWIGPQPFVNGFEAPLFPACSSLTVELDHEINLTAVFEGDLFEMEDQRNWTDGSFKTYCTPLSLGYPHQAKKGQTFHQKITIQLNDRSSGPNTARQVEPAPGLSVGDATTQTLPDIGFGIPPVIEGLSHDELDLLSELHPDHLKVEIHLQDLDWKNHLDKAKRIAGQLRSPLELALFLTSDPLAALEDLKETLRSVPVRRVIVFHEQEAAGGTTSSRWLDIAQASLSPSLAHIPFVGGTNGNFAELNRQPPDHSMLDGVSYPINPQVHSSDERSLIEAVEAQKDTVLTARANCGPLPIIISSVTLKPPFNQAAREEGQPEDPSELPANVDPRQMSLFAAAWTVGSLRSLAAGGASSVTFYELTGWRGLMESEAGSPLPEKFHSSPGMVYPLYWVFRFLAGMKNAALVPVTATRPLTLCGLAVKQGNILRVIISNYLAREQEILISGFPNGEARRKRLNEDSFGLAAFDRISFGNAWQPVSTHLGIVNLSLKAYETSFLEINTIEPKG